jgi:hypothetical protein
VLIEIENIFTEVHVGPRILIAFNVATKVIPLYPFVSWFVV